MASRRSILKGASALAGITLAAPYVWAQTTRTVLTSLTTFHVDPVNGVLSSDYLDATNPATPWPEFGDIIGRLDHRCDINSQVVKIVSAPGIHQKRIGLTGLLRGQKSSGSLQLIGSGPYSTVIRPSPANPSDFPSALEVNNGGAVMLENLSLSQTQSVQDAISAGKGGIVHLNGNVRLFASTGLPRNHMSFGEGARLTVNGTLILGGVAQCGLQMDQGATAYFQTDGQPGLAKVLFDVTNGGQQCHFTHSYLDVGGQCNLNYQAVGHSGYDNNTGIEIPLAVTGPRLHVRPGGIVDLYGAPVSSLPGNTDYPGGYPRPTKMAFTSHGYVAVETGDVGGGIIK